MSDGKKCFVGALIPDNEYDPTFENKTARRLCVEHNAFPDGMAAFLMDLQGIHDSHDPEEWPDMLRNVAYDYHLNTDVLKEVCS